jgi:hypothetical protein
MMRLGASAAKALIQNNAVAAAVNRCATQSQEGKSTPEIQKAGRLGPALLGEKLSIAELS